MLKVEREQYIYDGTCRSVGRRGTWLPDPHCMAFTDTSYVYFMFSLQTALDGIPVGHKTNFTCLLTRLARWREKLRSNNIADMFTLFVSLRWSCVYACHVFTPVVLSCVKVIHDVITKKEKTNLMLKTVYCFYSETKEKKRERREN